MSWQNHWINEFKGGWLKKLSNSEAECIPCKKKIQALHDTIKKHSIGKTHIDNFNNWNKLPKIAPLKNFQDKQNESLIAEIKLSKFVAEHNISYRTGGLLTNICKEIFPDSKIAKSM